MIKINMTKAVEIQKNRIRAERRIKFSALDIQYMKALEKGDAKTLASISEIKQKLRDAPGHASLADAKTPEALKAITLATILEQS